ncbi:hypothetical protein Acr_01g0005530 [Actinidia rufa]|uniref:Uncharacterized protein n=1 Tax=Actinidia rufa TaxID=165716 RepID=A0A7J0E2M7_9ERIC|nr:hypothetical protein Acr_01g0005530 [Actinidia rufa]
MSMVKNNISNVMALGILLWTVRTKRNTKGSKVLIVTWSDSEKEEESDSGDEIENYTAFMTSAVKTTKTSSKALDTEKSDESDDVVGSVEEESDDEDITLEDKVQKLETELANAHLSFKKFDADSQKIDEIWNAQRISFDMTRNWIQREGNDIFPTNK